MKSEQARSALDAKGPHFEHELEPVEALAWEQVEAGRYMPRRIRGSCKGRALG